MKTTLHVFNDYKAMIKSSRILSLPTVVVIDANLFNILKTFDGKLLTIDNATIFHNQWLNSEMQIIMPDFARVEDTQNGYYLEQTEEMINTRDATHQCGLCGQQFVNPPETARWCGDCTNNMDISEDDLYKAFIRPVSTLDIEIDPKSIYIPKWLKDHRTRTPELINGKLINV
jgi:hypothetical protein